MINLIIKDVGHLHDNNDTPKGSITDVRERTSSWYAYSSPP